MNSTIIDIAHHAGVSTATVSRVLNNYPFVKNTTRNKVLKAIEELNYFPDLIARSMVMGRTYNIGLIVGTLANPFFAETAEVIIKTAEMYKCHVTICVTEEKADKLAECVDLLLTRRVDGLIIGSSFSGISLPRLETSDVPYVLFNRRNGLEHADYVIQDNFQGAYDAVNHLIRLGHTRIGVLHGPLIFDSVEERVAGFRKALEDSKLKLHDHFHQEIDFGEAHSQIKDSLDRMFMGKTKPTAIFTTADFLALSAIEYLMNRRYRVPEDVAVVGFDNLRLSGHSLISLTTVGQRADEMAGLAVERLMQKIEKNQRGLDHTAQPWRITLKPQLIIRRTCGSHLRQVNYS